MLRCGHACLMYTGGESLIWQKIGSGQALRVKYCSLLFSKNRCPSRKRTSYNLNFYCGKTYFISLVVLVFAFTLSANCTKIITCSTFCMQYLLYLEMSADHWSQDILLSTVLSYVNWTCGSSDGQACECHQHCRHSSWLYLTGMHCILCLSLIKLCVHIEHCWDDELIEMCHLNTISMLFTVSPSV